MTHYESLVRNKRSLAKLLIHTRTEENYISNYCGEREFSGYKYLYVTPDEECFFDNEYNLAVEHTIEWLNSERGWWNGINYNRSGNSWSFCYRTSI